ncbi:MAG: hypothetical protein Q4C04_04480 [Clostridia bacterium]|nr:hypothetical protein [Clostridia bacterium]
MSDLDLRISPPPALNLGLKYASGAVAAVKYTAQNLTEEQKQQARANIGAMSDYVDVYVEDDFDAYVDDMTTEGNYRVHCNGLTYWFEISVMNYDSGNKLVCQRFWSDDEGPSVIYSRSGAVENGEASWDDWEALHPIYPAGRGWLGGVIVGEGLSIESNGKLSVQARKLSIPTTYHEYLRTGTVLDGEEEYDETFTIHFKGVTEDFLSWCSQNRAQLELWLYKKDIRVRKRGKRGGVVNQNYTLKRWVHPVSRQEVGGWGGEDDFAQTVYPITRTDLETEKVVLRGDGRNCSRVLQDLYSCIVRNYGTETQRLVGGGRRRKEQAMALRLAVRTENFVYVGENENVVRLRIERFADTVDALVERDAMYWYTIMIG